MRKVKILGISALVFASLLMGAIMNSTATYAATPPDDCFDFDIPTNTINDYYDNQGNNPSNPACPRDVDIPSTIGGTAVTEIGITAFKNKQLTSVTIPNSVTDLQFEAFANNQLETVTIPDSVTFVGQLTFGNNKLTSVTLGSGLTYLSAGMFSYNLLTEVHLPATITALPDNVFEWQAPNAYARAQASDFSVLQEVWYTRVYTADQSNPANLPDGQPQTVPESVFGADMNGDGDQTDTLSTGGHLINPAQVTITYEDATGNTLRPSDVQTGTGLHTYRAAENQTADLSQYFRMGTSQSFTAPTISGYSTVTPTSPYNMTLAAAGGNNALAFVYSSQGATTGGNNGSSPTGQVPRAPDSGVASRYYGLPILISSIAMAAVLLAAIIFVVSIKPQGK